MDELYFDRQIKTSLSRVALDRMIATLNGESISYESAYKAIYALAGAEEDADFVFTSSGCEATNQAVFSTYLNCTRKNGKNHFITSNVEEASSILSMSRLEQLGCCFAMAPADKNGCVTMDAIAETMTPRTAMVSLSWGNALTGVIQPVAEIAALCQERGVLFHVDATHVLGRGNYTLSASGADFFTFNGEQIHAPAGTGGLFVRPGVELAPLISGGKDPLSLRGGAINEATLVGLQHAAEEWLRDGDHLTMELSHLRDSFEKKLIAELPSCRILFREQERMPHISACLFPGVTSDALLYRLKKQALHATMGEGQFQHLRHILQACAIEGADSHCGLSFAFSRETNSQQIDKGAKIIIETVLQLQKCSQYLWKEAHGL